MMWAVSMICKRGPSTERQYATMAEAVAWAQEQIATDADVIGFSLRRTER